MKNPPTEKQTEKQEYLQGNPVPPAEQPRRKIALVLVELRCDEVAQVSSLISQAIDLIHAQRGTVFHVVSSIVIATFDFGSDRPADPEGRCEIAARNIHTGLGDKSKALYGTCEAIYGNFGSPSRFQFGPLIPSISGLMQKLQLLDFGSLQKFSH